MTHKEWLDNEYGHWALALTNCHINHFKEHPAVQRMLGEVDASMFYQELPSDQKGLLLTIDNIGKRWSMELSGSCYRMIYYAQKIMKDPPGGIDEIGAGSGQFYAVLKALGYKGDYYIYDLPEVKNFQAKYLSNVSRITGLNLPLKSIPTYDMCCSFYALGEFDDETKAWYIENAVKPCKRGLVIWNPHSGATTDVPWQCNIKDEFPLTYKGNKELTW